MSFIAFYVLDLVDFLLCFVFKVVDLLIEAKIRLCYSQQNFNDDGGCGGGVEQLTWERGGGAVVAVRNASPEPMSQVNSF
ncbi:hypothetical protein RJT34_23337 [Clitoria ternatea]|uniref:Uncharacterized protein n=1 Tax=Clitoria ternatea TaxID=43366 RepID=A0AAN9FNV1_CLITE